MELWQAIGNLSPGVAVGVLCLYFYNQVTLKYLDERKEMLQNQVTERKEWNDSLTKLVDRYDTRLLGAVEAMSKVSADMHALRGKSQEIFASLENRLVAIDNRLRGGGADD